MSSHSLHAPQTATFGAGCFWGVQYLFDQVAGISKSQVGYMGGDEQAFPQPTYEQVCTDTTGYAEVVQFEFDSSQVSYEKLLEIFFTHHDPTTPNQQGPDFGSQYRSVIFYHSPQQHKAAQAVKEKLQKKSKKPIVTEIVPAQTFFPAEAYHQKYAQRTGRGMCHL